MENCEIRPLTRQEQLDWLVPFLEGQIKQLEQDLYLARQELEEERKKNDTKKLVLTKKDEYYGTK